MGAKGSKDEPVRFICAGRELAGMLHIPAGRTREPGVVLCNAFGDERKSSCLAMTRVARALAEGGWPAVRFDYRGCGESPGEFVDATLSSRLQDVRAAVELIQNRAGVQSVCLLGLRLGGTIAARVAADLHSCSTLALIEPVRDGCAYFDGLLRRRLVRRMLTTGHGAVEGGDTAELVDLDGYAMRPDTLEQMRSLAIRPGGVTFSGRVLLVQVSHSGKLTRDTTAVREAFEAAGASVEVRALVLPPFWSRIDVVDTSGVNETVLEWLRSLSAGGGV